MNQPINVEDLSVSYRSLHALDGVSFSAKAGEFVAVVGRSGSGKTTLLHALAGIVPFSGKRIMSSDIGVVFQDHAVFPWLTAAENIGFGLKGESVEEKERLIQKNLVLAGLEDKKNVYPGSLSGGQVQRVALARALAHNPDVLLMDEPYASLDAYTRGKMQEWLLNVWSADKKTVVFVTHDIEEAVFLSDSVAVLSKGKLVRQLPVPFPRPRDGKIKFTPAFNEIKSRIAGLIDES